MAVHPVAFFGVAVVSDPFSFAVPDALIEVAPVDAIMTYVATPSMIDIVFELPLVNEIVTLSSQALHTSVLINLSECRLRVVLADSQVVIDWAVRWRIPDYVLSEQYS